MPRNPLLSGFSLIVDRSTPQRDLVGFASTTESNLFIRVVNPNGALIPDVAVDLDISGKFFRLELATGSTTTWISEPSTIRAAASKECFSRATSQVFHGGGEFHSEVLELVLTTPACLSNFPTNPWSFLSWRTVQGLSLPLASLPPLCSEVATCGQPLPRIPDGEITDCKRWWTPLAIPGETWSTMIGKLPLGDTYTVGVLDESLDLVVSDLGTLTGHFENGANHLTHAFQVPNLRVLGEYRLVLYENETDGILAMTDPFYFGADRSHSALVRYSHSENLDDFPYASGFVNEIRLQLASEGEIPQVTGKKYQPLNQSATRFYGLQRRRMVKFKTLGFDEGAHQAMQSLVLHDKVEINARRYQLHSNSYKHNLDKTNRPTSVGELETELLN